MDKLGFISFHVGHIPPPTAFKHVEHVTTVTDDQWRIIVSSKTMACVAYWP